MPMNDLYTLFAETMPLSRASASASVIGSSRSSSGLGSRIAGGSVESTSSSSVLKPHACERGKKRRGRALLRLRGAPAPRESRARADLEHRRRVVADRANVPAREGVERRERRVRHALDGRAQAHGSGLEPVSYTHLTLPTIPLV